MLSHRPCLLAVPWLQALMCWFPSVALCATTVLAAPPVECQHQASVRDAALDFLTGLEDEYAATVGVYTEPNAGGSLFWPSWWLNGHNGMTIDAECAEAPQAGKACLRIAWDGQSGEDEHRWRGVAFHDSPTWERKGPGHDLRGATRLSLWYRVVRLDGVIRFVFGQFEEPEGQHPIAEIGPKEVRAGGGLGRWQRLSIDLSGRDLSRVHTALQVIFDGGGATTGGGTVVDIDSATFDCSPEVALHLPRSYAVRLGRDFRWTHNSAHVYDAALVALAHLARGTQEDLARAGLIVRTLAYCVGHDRILMGQLRNAYSTGPIALVPNGPARLVSWWDPEANGGVQCEDYYCVGSTTGNAAWVMLAAIEYAERVRGPEREMARGLARELAIWIEARYDAHSPYPGFTYGFEGWEPQREFLAKSTEHNIDVYVAGRRYAQLWRDDEEERRRGDRLAGNARRFLDLMWDESEGRFLTGTLRQPPAGTREACRQPVETPNRTLGQTPADVNAWAALALGQDHRTRRAVDWVVAHCAAEDPTTGLGGFDFNDDRDGVWWEGTAHMALALRAVGRREASERVTRQLLDAAAHYRMGGGLPAASKDRLTTGFFLRMAESGTVVEKDWFYYRIEHSGATAWLALALAQWNPYWGIPVDVPPPSYGPALTSAGEGALPTSAGR